MLKICIYIGINAHVTPADRQTHTRKCESRAVFCWGRIRNFRTWKWCQCRASNKWQSDNKKNVGCGCWFWYLEISTLMLARLSMMKSMLKCGAVSSGSTFHVSRESCGGRRRFIGCDCRDHRGNGSNIRHHLPNCFHCLRASSSSETGGRLRKTGGGNRTRKQELDVLSVIQGLIRMWPRDG